jgi:hypothetical protein
VPDLDLHTADAPTRVFTPLQDVRPVLLNLVNPAVSTFLLGPIESVGPRQAGCGSSRSLARSLRFDAGDRDRAPGG